MYPSCHKEEQEPYSKAKRHAPQSAHVNSESWQIGVNEVKRLSNFRRVLFHAASGV